MRYLFQFQSNPWPQRWMQLSSMLAAGLSVENCLKTLNKTPVQDHQTLTKITQYVANGSNLTTALLKLKIIDTFDAALLANAETAGRLPEGLHHIARLQLKRQKTIRTLSGLALLPKAILIIGALVAMFIRIVQYGQNPANVISSLAITLTISFIAIWLAILVLTIDARIPLSLAWGRQFLHKHSRRFQQHFEQRFYASLVWQITSGVDTSTALKRNALLLNSKSYTMAVKQAASDVASGTDLPTTLIKNKLILSKRMRHILPIADMSGTTEKAISHELQSIELQIAHTVNVLISWWPKALYIICLLIVIRFMM